MSLIQTDNLWKTYVMGAEKVHALRGVTLAIEKGEKTKMQPIKSNPGNLLNVAEQVLNITLNEVLRNDLKALEDVNALVKAGLNTTKREIKYTLIQPSKSLDVSLLEFDSSDISKMIDLGIAAASSFNV